MVGTSFGVLESGGLIYSVSLYDQSRSSELYSRYYRIMKILLSSKCWITQRIVNDVESRRIPERLGDVYEQVQSVYDFCLRFELQFLHRPLC